MSSHRLQLESQDLFATQERPQCHPEYVQPGKMETASLAQLKSYGFPDPEFYGFRPPTLSAYQTTNSLIGTKRMFESLCDLHSTGLAEWLSRRGPQIFVVGVSK